MQKMQKYISHSCSLGLCHSWKVMYKSRFFQTMETHIQPQLLHPCRQLYSDMRQGACSKWNIQWLDMLISVAVYPYAASHIFCGIPSSIFYCCRYIIRNAVNASEHDAVIFTGSGCTGAVHKLIHALNFKKPPVSFQALHCSVFF